MNIERLFEFTTSEAFAEADRTSNTLQVIARERFPDRDPQAVLSEVVIEQVKECAKFDKLDTKGKLDLMKAEYGEENFKILLTNPSFQKLQEDWQSKYRAGLLAKVCDGISEWSRKAVSPQDVLTLLKTFFSALQISGML